MDVWYAAGGETSSNLSDCNEDYVELWNGFEYNDPGCYYFHSGTAYSVNNGIVHLNHNAGNDPFIWMYPLADNATINANYYRYVNVRYRVINYQSTASHNPRMAILFTKRSLPCSGTSYIGDYPFSIAGMSGHIRKDIDIDGNWHVVSFPVHTLANWNGTVTGLRFDYFDPSPHDANLGSEIEVDFLTVSRHPMIAEGAILALNPGDEYYPIQTTTYYAKKIDNCGPTSCVATTVVLPPLGINLAHNNDDAQCNVSENNWIHFHEPSSGRLLAAIHSGGQNLGSVQATAYLNGSSTGPGISQLVNACAPLYNPAHETAVLGRSWVIRPTIQPTNPVTVRLYFNQMEHNNLVPLSATSSSIDDPTVVYNDLHLSKYRNDGHSSVDNNFNNNCVHIPSGIMSIWQPHSLNHGNISSVFTGFDANGRYTEYTIPDFSEFWLHGSTVMSALAVTLTGLSASCDNNTITWTTASEQNSDYFTVEQSRDGYSWEEVLTVGGAGTTNSPKTYTVSSNLNASYYRLKQTDFDGMFEYYGPIHVDCGSKNNELIVYPNPNAGTFTLTVNTTEEMGEVRILIHDVSGKIVGFRDMNVLSGTNTVYFEGENLMPGTYIVSLQGKDKNTFTPVRLVIQ